MGIPIKVLKYTRPQRLVPSDDGTNFWNKIESFQFTDRALRGQQSGALQDPMPDARMLPQAPTDGYPILDSRPKVTDTSKEEN